MRFDRSRPLGDFVSLQRGNTYKSALLGHEGPVLLGLATIEKHGGFRSENLKRYSGESSEKIILSSGDLFVSLKDVTQSAALLGAVARVPEGITGRLTQDTVKLVFENDDSDRQSFIYWLLRTPEYRRYCKAHGTGTTNLGLPREDFLAFTVPPFDQIRSKLVATLELIEGKIANNRALAADLEAMARAIFKSWFVDFDPVKAKMKGRAPTGMDADTAALFPHELVESELGLIPKGWESSSIGDVADNIKSSVRPDSIDPDEPYVALEHFEKASLSLFSHAWGQEATSNKTRFVAGDLLFGKLRPYFHKVAIAPFDGVCSTDVLAIRPKENQYTAYAYCAFSNKAVIDYVTNLSGGTRMPRTNWTQLASFPAAIPTVALARAFNEICYPMLQFVAEVGEENQRLSELRDTLLPHLISGKIQFLEAADTLERDGHG